MTRFAAVLISVYLLRGLELGKGLHNPLSPLLKQCATQVTKKDYLEELPRYGVSFLSFARFLN